MFRQREADHMRARKKAAAQPLALVSSCKIQSPWFTTIDKNQEKTQLTIPNKLTVRSPRHFRHYNYLSIVDCGASAIARRQDRTPDRR